MRYWWVNQNQTYRREVAVGHLWLPKRNANGVRNPSYATMREVAPGDLIVSFVDTRLVAIGVAPSYCWERPKPTEFGTAGQNWEDVGWRVRVAFAQLLYQVRSKDHIHVLRPLLPTRYSPLIEGPQRRDYTKADVSRVGGREAERPANYVPHGGTPDPERS